MKRSLFNKGWVLAAAAAGLLTGNLFAQDLTSALLLTKSEQYDKAEAMLNQLIQKEPSNSKYYFFLGENKLLDYYSDTISNSFAQFTKEAKEAFQKGVTANANDPLNYVGLAKVASYLGDDATATAMRAKAKSFLLPYKNLKKIVPPAKEYAFALAKIADSYIKEGDVDTTLALPLIRQALKIDAKNPEIYLILGDIYNMLNDGTNSIKQYNFAQYLDPKSPTACMKIGNIYTRGRSLNAAREKLEEAITLDPNFAPAYRELGQVYYMSNRYEQSKANFAKYLELSAGNIPAMTRYVNSLFYAGDYDEVIKVVEEILAVDDSKAYMNRLAGYSYADRKKNPDYDKALYYMDQLFAKVSADRITMKDHHYTARIIMEKNQDLPKMVDELENLDQQLQRSKSRYNSAPAAEKTKLKPALDELTAKFEKMKADVAASQKEVERGFQEYARVVELKPEDAALKNEIAQRYYSFKRYDDAARTWAKLIDPAKSDVNAYMRIGRAYYNGNNFKAADSIFNIVIKKNPDYLDAYLWDARTYTKMDPDFKMGLAKPKFEQVVSVASKDSVANSSEMMEAFIYLGYYHSEKGNSGTARSYYNRMINLDPKSKDNKVKGYNGLGQLESKLGSEEKTLEGKLAILGRAVDAYEKSLALDPNNVLTKRNLSWVQEYIVNVKKGINPNEIKGTVKNGSGQPVAFASVKIKDTAAETFTNAKGEYKFEISVSSEVLVISAKGYVTKEVPITKSRIYNIVLQK